MGYGTPEYMFLDASTILVEVPHLVESVQVNLE